MTTFQLIALPVTAFLFVRSVRSVVRPRGPRGMALAAAGTWLASGLFILRPDWTMKAAALLGIGRGADLVLYLMAILFIAAFFHSQARFRSIDSQLTEIVRHLALAHPEKTADPAEDGTGAASGDS